MRQSEGSVGVVPIFVLLIEFAVFLLFSVGVKGHRAQVNSK